MSGGKSRSKDKMVAAIMGYLTGVSDERLLRCSHMIFVVGMQRLLDEQDSCELAEDLLVRIVEVLGERESLLAGDMAVIITALTLMVTAEYVNQPREANRAFTATKQSSAIN